AEMGADIQTKHLKVLAGRLRRVGGVRTLRLDVRVLVATNRDVNALVREGVCERTCSTRLTSTGSRSHALESIQSPVLRRALRRDSLAARVPSEGGQSHSQRPARLSAAEKYLRAGEHGQP